MKIQTTIEYQNTETAHVTASKNGRLSVYTIKIKEAKALYPDLSVDVAISKMAKSFFKDDMAFSAFAGYE